MVAGHQEVIEILESSGQYRILTKLQPFTAGQKFDMLLYKPEAVKKGLVIDTETTGWDSKTESIINLGMLLFTFDVNTGRIFEVLDIYNGFEDPGKPIPEIITRLTSIDDAMVAGKTFSVDMIKILSMLKQADIAICHNSSFDRPFLEKRIPEFKEMVFACTASEIKWSEQELITARSLPFLAFSFGYFYDAHLALSDCFATLELLRQETPNTKRKVLGILLDTVSQDTAQFWAWQAPFESKDLLKQENYRWIADSKCWVKSIAMPTEHAIRKEMDWLNNNVYTKHNLAKIRYVSAVDRYSKREFTLG